MLKSKTKLTKNEEKVFQEWFRSLPENLRRDTSLYDLRGAWKAGLSPQRGEDGVYHLGSRDPTTGYILKSSNHPTFNKTIRSELELGYTPTVDLKSGRLMTRKFQDGGKISSLKFDLSKEDVEKAKKIYLSMINYRGKNQVYPEGVNQRDVSDLQAYIKKYTGTKDRLSLFPFKDAGTQVFNSARRGVNSLLGTKYASGGSITSTSMADRIRKKTSYNMGGQIGGLIGNLIAPGVGGQIGSIFGESLGVPISSLFGGLNRTNVVAGQHSRVPAGAYTFAKGGKIRRIGASDAVEFVGNRHEEGGIDIADNIEVEGGETMDFIDQEPQFLVNGGKVKYRKGGVPYVFSDRLKVPGKNITFAQAHKDILKRGGDENSILSLVSLQERTSGRNKGNKMQEGGYFEDILGRAKGIVDWINEPGSGTIDKILPFAPAAFSLARGIFGKNRPTQVDRSAINTLRNTDIRFNINPALAENRAQTLAVQRSPGATTNSRLAAHAANLRATQDLYAQKENIEGERRLNRDFAIADVQQRADLTQAGYDEEARGQRGRFITEGLQAGTEGRAMQIENARMARRDAVAAATQLAGADPAVRRRILGDIGIDTTGMSNKEVNVISEKIIRESKRKTPSIFSNYPYYGDRPGTPDLTGRSSSMYNFLRMGIQ